MNGKPMLVNKSSQRRHPSTLACFVLTLLAGVASADELVLTNGVAAEDFTMMIGDKKQWDTVVYSDPISSASGYLSVVPDEEDGSIAATWNGKGEAQLFLANSAPADYRELAAEDAALVMLVKVSSPPRKRVTIKMGCGYPCSANADISKLLKALPVDEWLRVSISLGCFANGGLNTANVDTPLLLLTRGKLALSVSDVRLVPGVGKTATIRCE